jgi:hypothetical protein
VLSIDEKSQIQALNRTQRRCRCSPGRPREAHSRLRAARHHDLVRRARDRHRPGHRRLQTTASAPRISGVPNRKSTTEWGLQRIQLAESVTATWEITYTRCALIKPYGVRVERCRVQLVREQDPAGSRGRNGGKRHGATTAGRSIAYVTAGAPPKVNTSRLTMAPRSALVAPLLVAVAECCPLAVVASHAHEASRSPEPPSIKTN